MQRELIILDEDKAYARARIAELEQQIQALGPEFYEVFNQSSETWHDNAPFDALRDRKSVLDAERQQLKRILRSSMPSIPPQKRGKVGIGTIVTLSDDTSYLIAGDWTPHAGQRRRGALVVSSQTPVVQVLLGKSLGDVVSIGRRHSTIVSIVR